MREVWIENWKKNKMEKKNDQKERIYFVFIVVNFPHS